MPAKFPPKTPRPKAPRPKTFFVLVTFDLHYPGSTGVYQKVKTRLARLNLLKTIRKKVPGSVRKKLPSNTFVAKVPVQSVASAEALQRQMRRDVRATMKALRLDATVFVVVGQKWSWGRETV